MHTRTIVAGAVTLAVSAAMVTGLMLFGPARDRLRIEVIAEGLENPCGIAVQPDTGHVFVSLKQRIVRIIPGEPNETHDEIAGFPIDAYGTGPIYEFGPLGLVFRDSRTLIVGGGGRKDGEDIVRWYHVGSSPLGGSQRLLADDDMTHFAGPIKPGPDSINGEGNFFGLVYSPEARVIFVTSHGDDTKGWVSRIDLNDTGNSEKLTPFIKTLELTGVNAPTGITVNPEGKLLVSLMGEYGPDADSLLTLYDPATGELELKLETGLRDLVGIAFHPQTGQLYGVDFSWVDPARGGLYQLDLTGERLNISKVIELHGPTALAFSPEGVLYVTVMGDIENFAERIPGQVVKITNF